MLYTFIVFVEFNSLCLCSSTGKQNVRERPGHVIKFEDLKRKT